MSTQERLSEALDLNFSCDMYGFRSTKTARLFHAMRDGRPGDQLLDEDLARVAGGSVAPGGPCYSHAITAAERARADRGVFWKRPKGEGRMVCLDASGALVEGRRKSDSIRRQARKGQKALAAAHSEHLSADERRAKHSLALVFALTEQANTPATRRAIEAREPEKLKAPDQTSALLQVLGAI